MRRRAMRIFEPSAASTAAEQLSLSEVIPLKLVSTEAEFGDYTRLFAGCGTRLRRFPA
jgi:hypothetical protein